MAYRSFVSITAYCLLLASLAAATSAAEPAAVTATGVGGGFCVVIPANDGALLAALSCEGRFVVQGLAADDQLDAIRGKIPSGLSGLVSAQAWTAGEKLPYADNLVDLLVVDRDQLAANGPTDEELLRVVAPASGAVWQRVRGQWSKLTKPMPETYGDWTHYYGDATNNPVSADRATGVPTGLQWITGSLGIAREGTQLVEGGRYLGAFNAPPRPGGFHLSMRGAFNGVQQWRFAGEGVAPLTKFGPLVMADGVVYTLRDARNGPVIAIEAATGEVLREFDLPLADLRGVVSVATPEGRDREITRFAGLAVCGDALVVWRKSQVFCVDRKSGELRWSYDSGGKIVDFVTHDPVNKRLGMLLSIDRKTFLISGRTPFFWATEVVSLDLDDGRVAWRVPYPVAERNRVEAFVSHDGTFYFHNGLGLNNAGITIGAIDGKDGKTRWAKPNLTRWAGRDMHPTIGIGSLLVYPEAVVLSRSAVVLFDPRDGKSKGEWVVGNNRCENARGDALGFANFGHYFRFDGADIVAHRSEIARNACGGANLPAYGLHYYQPQVCGCFTAVRGLMALSSQAVPAATADGARLVRGPAYSLPPEVSAAAGDWPVLLHDAARSAAGAALGGAQLEEVWRTPLESGSQPGAAPDDWRDSANYNGPLSAPVVASGLVLVAAPDAHRIHALDAASGKLRWTATTGARVDTPPSVYGGRAYAGCRDGWVYCFDLGTGKLAWKFMAARAHKTIVAYDQPESAWPVHGSVLVEDDTVVATAGYHPDADGGIHCWGLDPATGDIRWRRTIVSDRKPGRMTADVTQIPGADDYFAPNRVLNTVANSDGHRVILPGLQLAAATGEVHQAIVGGKAPPKQVEAASTALGLTLSDWGMNHPWLRSGKGSFSNPGSEPERRSVLATAHAEPQVKAWGRRLAWDARRLVQVPKTGICLFVYDRTAPIDARSNAQSTDYNTKPLPKTLQLISLQQGKFAKVGWQDVDASAAILAGDHAVVAWSAEEPTHGRLESIVHVVDTNGRVAPVEMIIRPGVIDNGLATAGGRLFLVLEDGSVAAWK